MPAWRISARCYKARRLRIRTLPSWHGRPRACRLQTAETRRRQRAGGGPRCRHGAGRVVPSFALRQVGVSYRPSLYADEGRRSRARPTARKASRVSFLKSSLFRCGCASIYAITTWIIRALVASAGAARHAIRGQAISQITKPLDDADAPACRHAQLAIVRLASDRSVRTRKCSLAPRQQGAGFVLAGLLRDRPHADQGHQYDCSEDRTHRSSTFVQACRVARAAIQLRRVKNAPP